jgi:hypothetical protein
MPKFNVGKTKTAKPVRPKLRKPCHISEGPLRKNANASRSVRPQAASPHHKARRLRQRTLPAREETNAKSYSIHTPH